MTQLPTILKLNLAGAILNLHVIGNTEYAAVIVNATTTPILTSGVRVEIWLDNNLDFGHLTSGKAISGCSMAYGTRTTGIERLLSDCFARS